MTQHIEAAFIIFDICYIWFIVMFVVAPPIFCISVNFDFEKNKAQSEISNAANTDVKTGCNSKQERRE